jgi:uncharacterized protein (TIGR02246 family)
LIIPVNPILSAARAPGRCVQSRPAKWLSPFALLSCNVPLQAIYGFGVWRFRFSVRKLVFLLLLVYWLKSRPPRRSAMIVLMRSMTIAQILILICCAGMSRAQVAENAEEQARAVIEKFASARNEHDGKAAAQMYFDDGEYIPAGGQQIVRGRAALAALWSSGGNIPRVVTRVQILTPNIVVATVEARFSGDFGSVVGVETFLLIKDDGRWLIRVHQRR